MDGISLPLSDFPLPLIERHDLEHRIHDRGGEREIRFLRRSRFPVLPIWQDGQLLILPWGRKGGGLTWQRTVDAGEWAGAEPVEIRAVAGLDGGVWFRIRQGVRGLVARGEAYAIVEPASYYYRVMTRRHRMPVLIGERI
jgi:hypothetical protein